MGVDTNNTIGPYMIVRGVKTKSVKKNTYTCINKKCETNRLKQVYVSSQNFCAECGAKVDFVEHEVENTIDASDLYYNNSDFVDELCWTDPMGCGKGVFIPNHYCPIERNSSVEGYESVVDLMNVDIRGEINWFNERYKAVIDMFKKELGEDSVEVRWGTIEWYS